MVCAGAQRAAGIDPRGPHPSCGPAQRPTQWPAQRAPWARRHAITCRAGRRRLNRPLAKPPASAMQTPSAPAIYRLLAFQHLLGRASGAEGQPAWIDNSRCSGFLYVCEQQRGSYLLRRQAETRAMYNLYIWRRAGYCYRESRSCLCICMAAVAERSLRARQRDAKAAQLLTNVRRWYVSN